MGSLQITRATRPFGAAPAALPMGSTMVISPENQGRASFSAAPAVLPMVSTTVISPENHGRASFGAAPAVLPIGSTMVISPDRKCRAASATEGSSYRKSLRGCGLDAKRGEKTREEAREACQKRAGGAGGVKGAQGKRRGQGKGRKGGQISKIRHFASQLRNP